MSRLLTASVMLAALAFNVAGQDWYHERQERFRGEQCEFSVSLHDSDWP